MIKNLLQKYQAYKDKKFLARLERVLNNNIVKSHALIWGEAFFGGGVNMYIPKAAMEDIVLGIPLTLVLERLRQGYYEKQDA